MVFIRCPAQNTAVLKKVDQQLFQGWKHVGKIVSLASSRLLKTASAARLLASLAAARSEGGRFLPGLPAVTHNTTEVGLGKKYVVLTHTAPEVCLLPSGHSQAAPLEVLRALAATR